MVKMAALALLLLLAASPLAAPSDPQFMPPDLQLAGSVACYINSNADKTFDAMLQVGYVQERHVEWRMMLSRRQDALLAIEDCREWYEDVKKELEHIRKGKQK